MYILQMSFRSARHKGSGDLPIPRTGNRIAKWTILDESPRGLESLRLMAAVCGGTEVVPRLDFNFRTLFLNPDQQLQVELALELFSPYEKG